MDGQWSEKNWKRMDVVFYVQTLEMLTDASQTKLLKYFFVEFGAFRVFFYLDIEYLFRFAWSSVNDRNNILWFWGQVLLAGENVLLVYRFSFSRGPDNFE